MYNIIFIGTRSYYEQRASLLGARTLLGAPGLTTRSKDATRSKHTNGTILSDNAQSTSDNEQRRMQR